MKLPNRDASPSAQWDLQVECMLLMHGADDNNKRKRKSHDANGKKRPDKIEPSRFTSAEYKCAVTDGANG